MWLLTSLCCVLTPARCVDTVSNGVSFFVGWSWVVVLRDLESAKNTAHASAWQSATCGVDQFYDNHYALQQYRIPVDTFTDALMATGNYW